MLRPPGIEARGRIFPENNNQLGTGEAQECQSFLGKPGRVLNIDLSIALVLDEPAPTGSCREFSKLLMQANPLNL